MNITNFPVAIVATPRTRSTALAESLATKFELKVFNEPYDMFPPPWRADKHINGVFFEFYDWYKSQRTSRYVVKFMPHQISVLNPYEEILKDAFKIKLFREDKVAQIASFYVASVSGKFFKKSGDRAEKFVVPIDRDSIFQAAGFIMNQAYLIDNLRIDWDYEASYESLGFIEDSSKILSDVPDNIDEVRTQVKNLIQKWY
jgi:hypothetical protein